MSNENLEKLASMLDDEKLSRLHSILTNEPQLLDASLQAVPEDYIRIPDLTRITDTANVSFSSFLQLATTSNDYAVQLSVLADLLVPVGIALPWHSETIPDGWAIYDGSQFDMDVNPKNALLFPTGRFPNYSGKVPEGFIDAANGSVGSEQTGQVISHGHNATSSFAGTAKAPTASFAGTAKAPTASFKGNALGTHFHYTFNSIDQVDNSQGVNLTSSNYPNRSVKISGNSQNYITQGSGTGASVGRGSSTSAGTPSGTVTVNSYTPVGSVTVNSYTPAGTVSTSVAANGGARNTVDRIVCYWIGRLG